MAPNQRSSSLDNNPEERTADEFHDKLTNNNSIELKVQPRKYEIIYTNIATFLFGHLTALYGLYLACTSAKWQSLVFAFFIFCCAEIGVTAGAHRLWSHRAFKAKLPLHVLLMIMNTLAFQNTIIHWARDHRLHHRYSDTDSDPHNAERGLFFSHVGWLLVKKHPNVKLYGKQIDISDLTSNPVLQFQKKYAIPWILLVAFIIPTLIPVYFWEETINIAWHVNILRYIINLNVTFLVNSYAHFWGNKPYDQNIKPVQNLGVSFLTLGEGFHNYHHAFPWDYKTSELGNKYLNITTLFIEFFAWIGWAYDLKSASNTMIADRKKRTGDGSNLWGYFENKNIRGNSHESVLHREIKNDL